MALAAIIALLAAADLIVKEWIESEAGGFSAPGGENGRQALAVP